MNRTTSLKRTGFARKFEPRPVKRMDGYTVRPRPPAEPERQLEDQPIVQVPKFVYVKSPTLREAYRLLPCQYDRDDREGSICAANDGTVCCTHSNWGIHGKGGRIKATDDRGASGCNWCHHELDQGTAWSNEEKQARWWAAHVRSVRLLVAMGAWPKRIPVPDIEHNPFALEAA